MDKYKITLAYVAGDYPQITERIETEHSVLSLHHIVAEAFGIEEYEGGCATIVEPNVWQVTLNGGVFIVEKA